MSQDKNEILKTSWPVISLSIFLTRLEIVYSMTDCKNDDKFGEKSNFDKCFLQK